MTLTNVNKTHSGTYTCKAQSHINATDKNSIEVRIRLTCKYDCFSNSPIKTSGTKVLSAVLDNHEYFLRNNYFGVNRALIFEWKKI